MRRRCDVLLTCKCGAKNRIPIGVRARCGACKHEFTPSELAKATNEPPPPSPLLTMQDDIDVPTRACNDDENCGWEGGEEELDDDGRCPECGKRVHKL
jgi:rubredoxin